MNNLDFEMKKKEELALEIARDKHTVIAVSKALGFPIPRKEEIQQGHEEEIIVILADIYSVLLLKESLKSEEQRLKIKNLWDKYAKSTNDE